MPIENPVGAAILADLKHQLRFGQGNCGKLPPAGQQFRQINADIQPLDRGHRSDGAPRRVAEHKVIGNDTRMQGQVNFKITPDREAATGRIADLMCQRCTQPVPAKQRDQQRRQQNGRDCQCNRPPETTRFNHVAHTRTR